MSDRPSPPVVAVDAPGDLLTDEELESLATALLRSSCRRSRDLEYPFVEERSLRRASRRDRDFALPAPAQWDELERDPSLLDQLLAAGTLPAALREVVELSRRGLSVPQIARTMGIKERTAFRWREQAVRILRQRAERLQRRPASETELSFRRSTFVTFAGREQHCRPGREGCRHDGICKHRWYLQYAERKS